MQMPYRSALTLTFMLLAACKPTAPAAETAVVASPAAAEAATPPATAPAPSVDAAFAKDMPYADLRKRLTDAGWLPLREPMCWENMGDAAAVCGDLPEVESCSSDGHCVMSFASASEGKRIRVTTYGPTDRWNTPGEEAALAVKSWDVAAVQSPAATAPACPSRDFDAFLRAFAADDGIERAFTTPLVKVAELYSGKDEESYDDRPVYISAASYTGFNVKHDGKAFHFVDASGKVDPSPLSLNVVQESEQVRVVRYQYGMSEGNSYRFENKGDCWYLSQDPEAPAP
jgi:hypothetical protein